MIWFCNKSFYKLIPIVLFLACYIHASAQLTSAQIDSLANALRTAREDTNKVRLYMELGNNVGYYDMYKALEYGKKGYELSRKINYPRGIANMLYLMSSSYMDLGEYRLSDSLLTQAEGIYNSLKDIRSLTKVLSLRGDWNLMQANYWKAADFYGKAAEGFANLKDTAYELNVYTSMIAALSEVNNFEKAVILSKKILDLAILRKDTLQIGYTLQGLTTDLIYLNRLDEAQKYLPALVMTTNTTLDNNLAADTYGTIGTYYYYRKDYLTAIGFFKKAIDKSLSIQSKYLLANHNNSLGSAYLKLNNFQQARLYLDHALALAKQYNSPRAEYNADFALSEYFEKTGTFDSAFWYLKQHLELKDSILKIENNNYVSYIETLYETNKKENEILRLQKLQEQKDFSIKRRNIYIGISVGLLVFLSLIFVLLYRNSRNKQKLSQQQADLHAEKILTMEQQQQVVSLQAMINGQESERTRIAKDLHDGLGGILSTVKMHFSTLGHDLPLLQENELYRKGFSLVDRAAEDLRKIAQNMMPEVLLKIGLIAALEDFCNMINAGKLLRISLQAYGMEKRLSASTEIMIYRIIQELVNNIIKHAGATEAIIQFNKDGNRLSITVEDNGRGFDMKEAEEKRSMGILTVKSRVDYLNGRLSIDSRQEIGTTVMIDLLLNE